MATETTETSHLQSSNLVRHNRKVTRDQKEKLNGHKGCVVWFTGLSASGKSTVSNLVEHKLYKRGLHTYLLDGDDVRHGLSAGPKLLKGFHGEEFSRRFGLEFSSQDREENIRRIGCVAQLFCEAGIITLIALISPSRRDRDAVRAAMKPGDFIEVFVDAPVEVCERRDPKGLYKKARAGRLEDFTGVSAPYEPPTQPELVLNTEKKNVGTLADEVISYIERRGILPKGPERINNDQSKFNTLTVS